MTIGTILLVSLASAVATLLLCLFAPGICSWLDIIDVPDSRKLHAKPTPLMGGLVLLAVVVPLTISLALFAVEPSWTQNILVWSAASAAMALVGLADDRHTLSARDRLLVSFLVFGSAAIVDPLFNVRVLTFALGTVEIGLGTGWLAVVFTAICCVGLVNAVNMADGKNGLVIGMTLGWLILLGFRAPAPLLPLVAITGSAWIILLLFNLKGRLFLGDGGSYGIATCVGLLSILIYNSRGEGGGRLISAEELMILFAIPVLDSFRLTFLRLRKGVSPMTADRNHLHHHLHNRFGWPAGLAIYWAISLVPSALMLFTNPLLE
jgi:UDP-GlcNAc:undecaprenyl-phosphate/decaprenyl-phosphate GlcNAc-1-phosphate transferase